MPERQGYYSLEKPKNTLPYSDTPLTKAVLGKEPKRMIMLLCRYGAFLEFRDRNGYTALHHASVNGKHESMQVGACLCLEEETLL